MLHSRHGLIRASQLPMRLKEGENLNLNIFNQRDGPQARKYACLECKINMRGRMGRLGWLDVMVSPNYVYLAYVSGADSAAPTESYWGYLH